MLNARPLRVAILCSRRAPGLVHVLNRDRNRGSSYDIVACLSSEPTFAEEVRVERRGIPTLPHSIHGFYRLVDRPLHDLEARREYDARTARKLKAFSADLVVLTSYTYVLTEPMLEAFPGRIVNLHHADLLARRPDGGPRYPGLRAVRDAILAGERETRASAHLVTAVLDGGPVLLRSWPFPVPDVARWAMARQASDVLRAVAFAQTEWMLRSAWGPMLVRTLQVMAQGGPHGPYDLLEDGSLQPIETRELVAQ
jgi:folate-dependent phosphoribosylglycinamide formyltransferase PurN